MKTQTQNKRRGSRRSTGTIEEGVKIDWAFRRLRHQAIRFLARGDEAVRRDLSAVLAGPRTYSEMEKTVIANLGPRKGPTVWRQFLDQFFGHKINRRVA